MGKIRGFADRRRTWLASILAVILCWSGAGSLPLAAQEVVRVAGTDAVAAMLGPDLKSNLTAMDAALQTTRSSASLTLYCSEATAALLRISPLTSAEWEECAVDSVELLLGHRIYALFAASETPKQCLNRAELDQIFAPSAAARTVDWQQIDETLEEGLPLKVWLPARNQPAYLLLDQIVTGSGLRADAATIEDEQRVLQELADDPGSIALLEWRETPNAITPLQLEGDEFPGCLSADVTNVEAGTYPLAISVYLYVNRELWEQNGAFALAEAGSSGQFSGELLLPSAAAQEINRAQLTDEDSLVSAASDSFVIPSVLGGEIRIGGAAEASIFLPQVVAAFTASHPSMSIRAELRGGPAGESALCSRELDLAIHTSPLSAEALAQCEENGIHVLTLQPAAYAVIALSHANNVKLRCISLDRWAAIWSWPGESVAAEEDLLLFAPADGHLATDIMMLTSSGSALPIRRDTEISDDPMWRAAAVGVVEHGLSYFDWAEYQQVLSTEPANLQAVRFGEQCAMPAEEEILNGNYPLSRLFHIHVNANSLSSVQLKSWLWFAFGGGNHTLLSEAGLVLADGLTSQRELLQAFAEADALFAAQNQSSGDEDADGETTAEEG
ncbi:MAG: hypothetical protein OXG09_08765 [Chloroflexi bacterium]|nr:hypothetical protein [Chloroflexota bacterium]